MINESMMDQCITMCCSVSPAHKSARELFSVMKNFTEIINKSENLKNKEHLFNPEIGEIREKMEILTLLAVERCHEGPDFELSRFLSKISSGKLKKYVDSLPCYVVQISDSDIETFLGKVLSPKTIFCDIVGDVSAFKTILENIESGEYSDYTQISEKWNDLVFKQYKNIVSMKKFNAMSEAVSLDINEDPFDHVMDRLKSTINVKNIVQTGFDDVDNNLPYMGLEKRRIYIVGGESGVGKSIFLMNVVANDIKKLRKLSFDEDDNDSNDIKLQDKPSAHLFITAENLIDESLLRFYCTLTGIPHHEAIRRIRDDKNFSLKDDVLNYTKAAGVNVVFHYVPSMTANLLDVESIIETTAQKYNLRSVIIDYLDLIRSGSKTDVRYLELGEVSTGLKRIATMYDIPVLTATQLNRSGYNNQAATLTSISGSMEKVNDADFVAFLQRTDKETEEYFDKCGKSVIGTPVNCAILKNRNGNSGHKFKLLLPVAMNGKKSFNYTFISIPDNKQNHMTDAEDYENALLNDM